jgi:hypothetical protein
MGAVDFFGGLTQGFGNSYFGEKGKKKEREERTQRSQHDLLSQVFKNKAEEGDNEGAAQALEMMANIFDPKGKEQQHPYRLVAGKIRGSQGVSETNQGAQGQAPAITNDLGSGGMEARVDAPGPPQSPMVTKKIQAGYFSSPLERKRKEIQGKVEEADALRPGEMEAYGQKEELRTSREMQVAQAKAGALRELEELRQDNRIELPLAKVADIFIKGGADPSTAMQLASQFIRDKEQAKLTDLESRATDRERRHKLGVDRFEEFKRVNSARLAQGETKIAQGDRKLTLDEEKARNSSTATKGFTTKIDSINKDLNTVGIEYRQAIKDSTNMLIPKEKRAEAAARIPMLQRQYDMGLDDRDRTQAALEEHIRQHGGGAETVPTRPTVTPKGSAAAGAAAAPKAAPVKKYSNLKVGQEVTMGGRKVKIKAVYPDGSFDIE